MIQKQQLTFFLSKCDNDLHAAIAKQDWTLVQEVSERVEELLAKEC